MSKATFVVGLQYGDEGKGKIVDLLAEKHDVVIRANGGSNAGHTIVLPSGESLALHQLPSGVIYSDKLNIIANGCYFDPVKLLEEIRECEIKGIKISPKNLVISKTAHLVLPHHKLQDAAREGGFNAQGSTKAGIAFVASDKYLRIGLRADYIINKTEKQLYKVVLDKLQETGENIDDADAHATEFALAALSLSDFIKDSIVLVQKNISKELKLLIEGAQAFGLDIDHGKYPYVTSSHTTVPGLMAGSGLNFSQVGRVVGIAKATPSKVGGGPFVTKITDKKIAEQTRGEKGKVDSEFGATTGREREVGYLDLVALKRAVDINGVNEIALTKFDCLNRHGDKTNIAVEYIFEGKSITDPPSSGPELEKCKPVYKEFDTWLDNDSEEAKDYIKFVEDYLNVPITMLGTGPGRNDLIQTGNK